MLTYVWLLEQRLSWGRSCISKVTSNPDGSRTVPFHAHWPSTVIHSARVKGILGWMLTVVTLHIELAILLLGSDAVFEGCAGLDATGEQVRQVEFGSRASTRNQFRLRHPYLGRQKQNKTW